MSPFFDSDPMLRRLEQRALLFCLVAAAASVVVRRGALDVAVGVLGGGLLMATSYWAIRSSVGALVGLVAAASAGRPAGEEGVDRGDVSDGTVATGGTRGEGRAVDPVAAVAPKPGVMLVRLAARYALLGLMAYGMIARLRLHPLGLFLGISSLFAAASLEALQGPVRRRR